jgi:hypothetical protein
VTSLKGVVDVADPTAATKAAPLANRKKRKTNATVKPIFLVNFLGMLPLSLINSICRT